MLASGGGEADARTNAEVEKPPAFDFRRLKESEQRIIATLSEETSFEFFETSINNAIEFCAKLHGITIVIDEASLNEEGITSDGTDDRITRRVSGIPLGSALKIILKRLGLMYLVEDGVLKITTQNVAQARKRQRPAVDLNKSNPSEQRILAALSEETAIEFFDTSLVDAMQFLSTLHGITIILDETAVGEESIATDEPITQVLSGISLESVFNITLKPLGLDLPD